MFGAGLGALLFFYSKYVQPVQKAGQILGLVDRDQHVACKALGVFIEVRRVARRKASGR
jgi:hypothetical protein